MSWGWGIQGWLEPKQEGTPSCYSSAVAPGADFLGTGMLVPRLSRLGLAGREGCRMYQVSSCAQWQPCMLQGGEQGALLLRSSLGGLFLQHQFCSGG